MKVILVNGGPHPDGCTNLALEEIEKTLNENNIETEYEHKFSSLGQPIYRLEAYLPDEVL